jgi:hypothetical protein
MPTPLAIQCVDETTPNVPAISGRVVKVGGTKGGMATELRFLRGQTNYLTASVESGLDRA